MAAQRRILMLVLLAAYLILPGFPLSQPLTVGLLLLATTAGLPFLPGMAQVAKVNPVCSMGYSL